jgi:U3 small nucleolar RNA-associated protein 20
VKEVHLPSALSQTIFDHDIAVGSFFIPPPVVFNVPQDNDSHFHGALDHWRQLNLSPAFILFANQADLLSASMPLLLHHWHEIIDLWFGALEAADDEALRALLE